MDGIALGAVCGLLRSSSVALRNTSNGVSRESGWGDIVAGEKEEEEKECIVGGKSRGGKALAGVS